MNMRTKVVVAIDPGGTTGLAWSVLESNSAEIKVQQVPDCHESHGVKELHNLLAGIYETYRPWTLDQVMLILSERFDFRHEERYRDKIDYTAPEVNGMLRHWVSLNDNAWLKFTPASLGKGFWHDWRIKKLGLWVPGQKHAMDALRHLLRYRLFELHHNYLLDKFRPEPSEDIEVGI